MPVMIDLTTAEHGGRVSCDSCGSGGCGTGNCGPDCGCGCPYTGMEERSNVEPITLIEERYPGEWLALVIPPSEDEFAPENAMLVVHSHDDEEVWAAVSRITHNQVVHVYYNGALDDYLTWADTAAPTPTRQVSLPIIPLTAM